MKTIEEHLEAEKQKPKPSPLRIKELETIKNKGTITLEEWRLTGRFTPKEVYVLDNPGINLKGDTEEVVEYAGDILVEVSKSGHFSYEKLNDKNLEKIENLIWSKISEKLLIKINEI